MKPEKQFVGRLAARQMLKASRTELFPGCWGTNISTGTSASSAQPVSTSLERVTRHSSFDSGSLGKLSKESAADDGRFGCQLGAASQIYFAMWGSLDLLRPFCLSRVRW